MCPTINACRASLSRGPVDINFEFQGRYQLADRQRKIPTDAAVFYSGLLSTPVDFLLEKVDSKPLSLKSLDCSSGTFKNRGLRRVFPLFGQSWSHDLWPCETPVKGTGNRLSSARYGLGQR